MDEHKIILDYIDQYHAGEILEADFQKRLKTDHQLQEAFAQHQQDLHVIRAGAKEQLKKKAALALERQEQKKVKTFSLKRPLQFAAAIAFFVVSTFLIQNYNQSSPTPNLFATHFELPDPAGERNASTQSLAWNEAMTTYANQDFEKTIELLQPLIQQDTFLYPDRGRLFLAISQLMIDEDQKAIKLLTSISPESSYIQDAEWYQALAYLKIENLTAAKIAFQKIVVQARHFKQKEAKQILESLK